MLPTVLLSLCHLHTLCWLGQAPTLASMWPAHCTHTHSSASLRKMAWLDVRKYYKYPAFQGSHFSVPLSKWTSTGSPALTSTQRCVLFSTTRPRNKKLVFTGLHRWPRMRANKLWPAPASSDLPCLRNITATNRFAKGIQGPMWLLVNVVSPTVNPWVNSAIYTLPFHLFVTSKCIS